jgi:hypothetical protein
MLHGMLALIVLCILLTWLVCAAVCVGMGSLLFAAFERLSDSKSQHFSLAECYWSGVAVIAAILQLYHFVRPIDATVGALLCAAALFGVYIAVRRFDLLAFRGADVLLFLAAAAIIAFRSAAPSEHYDTGLYGAQAIRWFTTYPVVPGLGNLLGQLGFNSSIVLCIAALDHGPWRDLAHHLFVGFLLAALFASIVPAALRVSRGENSSSSDWFLTLLFIPAAIAAAMGKLSGANTDLPTTVVCLAGAYFLFRGLDAPTRESARENNQTDYSSQRALVTAMLLFSLAVTFKLSSLVFALTGWVVCFVALWHSNGPAATRRNRVALAVVALSAAMVLPWICRGLILTGYPFFPSTAMGISAEWKVPAANAEVQAEFARSFARIPQIPLADTSGYRWLRPWFRELIREREGFLIPAFFTLAGAVFLGLNLRRERSVAVPQWMCLFFPAFAGVLFWFFEAPAIRFGEPVLWTAGATGGTFAALQALDSKGKKCFFLFALVLVTAWAAHPRLLWNSYFRPGIHVRTFLPLPRPNVVPHQTDPGLTIYVPVETNQCWDAALPCSPYFDETLRLRRRDDLGSGFVSNGPAAAGRVR